MAEVKISVVIITYNEERNIERCIHSVKEVADEIVVVDSYSTDKTKEICRKLGVQFIEHPFEGYVQQKNFALAQATYDHVLSLDADEALSTELYESIVAVKQNWTYDAYRFNRLTNYCGHWIRHCGWYPDTKLRLWDRRKGQWGGTNPHDSVELNGETSLQKLKGDLLHYSYYNLEQHLQQINSFTTIAANNYYNKRKRVIPIIHLYLYPLLIFFNRYVLKLGFLDGVPGLMVCKSAAYYKFLKYAKLSLLYKSQENQTR
uniref:Glycosyltransferase family 2 protein n=1 Tax=Roseihalotalea indica TaxID=2867963 RepID=A0AA49JGV2_9BACT|nr:glycosyltransferase family 2 protein [Tunicatimonas sp. TK19036]